MKRDRYLVFAGDLYYPLGGADDLVARISEMNLQDIVRITNFKHGCWLHVYDSIEGKVVLRHTDGVSFYEESTGTQYVNFTKILNSM